MSDKNEIPHFTLEVVKWEGKLHCCYLNNFRIAGSKPWAGGETVKSWPVPLRDLVQAIPELRKTAEDRDTAQSQLTALREGNRLLNHDIASFLETTAKVCELLGIDTDDARHAEGKPSDVLFSHATALQQRLADAERRNAVMREASLDVISNLGEFCCGLQSQEEVDYITEQLDKLHAALTKPEEAKS